MKETTKVNCAWYEKENIPKTSKEKSEYGDILNGLSHNRGLVRT